MMKFAAKLRLQVKKGYLPYLTNEVYKRNCGIRNIILLETGQEFDEFVIEVLFSEKGRYDNILKKISAYENNFRIISTENLVEKEILNGMLNVSGIMRLDDLMDYNINLLGASETILNSPKEKGYPGILKNIGLFCILPGQENTQDEYVKHYILAERDAVVINRFAGLNAFPLLASINQIDDFINIVRRLDKTFSAVRLLKYDAEDPAAYERIYSDLSLPVLTRFHDEIPLFSIITLLHLLNKNNIDILSCTVGIVGINISSMRIARLLLSMGVRRVIGSDSNVMLMHNFEKQGGFALTNDSVFSNSDIIFIIKEQYEQNDLNLLGSGQVIISLVEKEIDADLIGRKGVRDFLQSGWMQNSALYPGILKGMIESGIRYFDDKKIIQLAKKIFSAKSKDEVLPGVFSDLHTNLPGIIKSL